MKEEEDRSDASRSRGPGVSRCARCGQQDGTSQHASAVFRDHPPLLIQGPSRQRPVFGEEKMPVSAHGRVGPSSRPLSSVGVGEGRGR